MKKFQLQKSFLLEAAHFLPLVDDEHKCKRVHGHSYTLTFCISSEKLIDGMVCDFKDISFVVKTVIINVLDHRLLNDFPRLENPTAENLAAYCAEIFLHEFRMLYYRPTHPWHKDRKKHFIRLDAVEVQETATSVCRYEVGEHI